MKGYSLTSMRSFRMPKWYGNLMDIWCDFVFWVIDKLSTLMRLKKPTPQGKERRHNGRYSDNL